MGGRREKGGEFETRMERKEGTERKRRDGEEEKEEKEEKEDKEDKDRAFGDAKGLLSLL